jgi:hypothetical protein
MTMKVKLIALLSAVMLVLGLGVAAASPALSARLALCPQKGTNQQDCHAVADSNTGSPVKAETLGASGWFENITNLPLNDCGSGFVTSTCPFIVGSGLNSKFLGDHIFHWEFVSTGTCLGVSTNDVDTVTRNCSTGRGINWIADGAAMVNRVASDDCYASTGGSADNCAAYQNDNGHNTQIGPNTGGFLGGSEQWAGVSF